MAKLTMDDLLKILAATLTGMSVDRFQAEAKQWLETARDPRWKRPYTELTYQLQAVDHLRVHRMRDPQRAVLIEGGDARLRRHELRATLFRSGLHELDDRLFGGSVVPRRQRIWLSKCLGEHQQK
jgi:hypothetical protein